SRHKLNPVPPPDCGHLGQIIREHADFAVYIIEECGRMSGHRKDEHSCTRRGGSLKTVDGVARQVSKLANSNAHRFPVDLKVKGPLDHIVRLVPVVPMRWRAMPERNLFLHQ